MGMPKGYKRVHSEFRKIVPRYRRFNPNTAAGRIKKHAYEMDMTRKELAEALGVCVQTLNKYLITLGRVPPHYIDKLCDVLALPDTEKQTLHRMAAIEAGYKIGGEHAAA